MDPHYQQRTSPAGPLEMDAHEGKARHFLERYQMAAHQAAAGGGRGLHDFLGRHDLVKLIADARNLLLAWQHLERYGGHAPGPDGRTYADFTRLEKLVRLREVSRAILDGGYKHGDIRNVEIAKPKGGTRRLSLANLVDRVVGRATKQILQPLLDPLFDAYSFCRRWRGPWTALAYAEVLSRQGERWVWIGDDCENAFDRVPVPRLMEVVRTRLPSAALGAFLPRLLAVRRRGLLQGSPLSPFLVELYLFHVLDDVWQRRHATVPKLRFLDDHLLLAGPGDDPLRLYADLQQMLSSAGMPLKGSADRSIYDLRLAKTVPWLGYRIGLRGTELEYRLPLDFENEREDVLDRLRTKFLWLHRGPDAARSAIRTVEGCLNYFAPCYPYSDRANVYRGIVDTARLAAIEELPTFARFDALWKQAHSRWDRYRNRIQHSGCERSHSPDRARWQNLEQNDPDECPFDDDVPDAIPNSRGVKLHWGITGEPRRIWPNGYGRCRKEKTGTECRLPRE